MKHLWLLLIVISCLSALPYRASGEEIPPPDGWSRERTTMVIGKDVGDLLTAGTTWYPLFYAESKWLDDPADNKFKNYSQEIIGPPTRSEKHQGVLVVREGGGINIDTNGDDRPDAKLVKSDIVKIKVRYIDREAEVAIAFKLELDESSQKPHWSFSRGYYHTAKIAGTPVLLLDENMDGFINVHASDGIIIGSKEKYGSYLSATILVAGKLYDVIYDDQGRFIDYVLYKGPSVKVDFARKFKGPMKPWFVVLRSPFDKNKPDPRSVCIFLPKGVGIAPPGLYDFKWTMLSERCHGRPETRPDQWIEEDKKPYFIQKGVKDKVYPPCSPVPIELKEGEDKLVEWGQPFGLHIRPTHMIDDGGAKVDLIAIYAGDFIFYDGKLGISYWTPIKFKSEGAAMPEDMSFDVFMYNPKGELLSKNTRYVKGGGGGTGDADPNWQTHKIAINGQRGVFKLQIKSVKATAHFGEIECYNDFEIK